MHAPILISPPEGEKLAVPMTIPISASSCPGDPDEVWSFFLNSSDDSHLSENDPCYQKIHSLINSKHYKSNYGTFDPNSIRIKIDIIGEDGNTAYLVDVSGAIRVNERTSKLSTINLLDSTIKGCS